MSRNPESMNPTLASKQTIVREANKIVFQAAQGIVREEKKKAFWERQGTMIVKAINFMNEKI